MLASRYAMLTMGGMDENAIMDDIKGVVLRHASKAQTSEEVWDIFACAFHGLASAAADLSYFDLRGIIDSSRMRIFGKDS